MQCIMLHSMLSKSVILGMDATWIYILPASGERFLSTSTEMLMMMYMFPVDLVRTG